MDIFNKYLERNKMTVQSHQTKGVNWCVDIETNGVMLNDYHVKSGILADEMGLGKTIQMIGLMLSNFKLHTLIVLPKALLEQWKSIIINTLNHRPLVYHGTSVNQFTEQIIKDSPIVLTTYGMLSRTTKPQNIDMSTTFGLLHTIEWDRIIFDEAHHLRNSDTISYIAACRIKATHKWLVTGTPLQNSVNDLYSLCDVIGLAPTVYKNYQKIVLKRSQKEAGVVLPKLTRINITVKWETTQEKCLAEDIHAGLTFNKNTNKRVGNVFLTEDMHHFTKLHLARQSCIDSSLMIKSLLKLSKDGLLLDSSYDIGHHQSKTNKVIETIYQRKNNDTAKLVFCHYKAEIDNIKNRLTEMGMNVSTFDGRTKQAERLAIISRRDLDVLVIQIKTGCEGLNLQYFSEVYFVSPHWNPAVEDQAIARSYRIGQTKPVTVFNFKMESFGETQTNHSSDIYVKHVQIIKRVNNDMPYPVNETKEEEPLCEDDGEPIKCAICLCDQHTYTKLECGHCFHKECIIKWFNQSLTCPNCSQ